MNRPCPSINKAIKQDYRMLLRLFNSANKFSRKYNKTLASMLANNSDSNLKWWKSKTGYHETLPDIIGGCFVWDNSPQGYDFWYAIHLKLNNGIDVHGKKVDEPEIPF